MLSTQQDIAGLLLTVLLAVLVLPGYAIGRLTGALEFRAADPARRVVLALLLATAVLPIADSMIARFAGLWAALAVNLALAAVAITGMDRASIPKLSRAVWLGLGAAPAVLLAVWVGSGALHGSLRRRRCTPTSAYASCGCAISRIERAGGSHAGSQAGSQILT